MQIEKYAKLLNAKQRIGKVEHIYTKQTHYKGNPLQRLQIHPTMLKNVVGNVLHKVTK